MGNGFGPGGFLSGLDREMAKAHSASNREPQATSKPAIEFVTLKKYLEV
jgi:hypothetical protein